MWVRVWVYDILALVCERLRVCERTNEFVSVCAADGVCARLSAHAIGERQLRFDLANDLWSAST